MDKDLWTAQEVMDYLRVSRATLHRWVRDGRLPRVQLGERAVRYRRTDVLALVNRGMARRGQGGEPSE